jgi:putative ABC transport system permease protein
VLHAAHVPAASGLPTYAAGVPNDRLPALIDRAGLIERGLHGTVLPVALAGGLLALLLVAAAGGGWAERRMAEVRLLASRGVGPVALAGKAALELAVPTLAGTVLGWAAARVLVTELGPAHALDPAASAQAGWAAAAAAIVGLFCAAAVAGLRARASVERVIGSAPRWPAAVPWELLLLAGAGICRVLLQHRPAVEMDANVARVNALVVAFPLLAVAGAAVLLARLLTRLLPALRRRPARRGTAVFLAVNRLAAARAVTAVLLVAVTLPVAVLGYTGTLTTSSSGTLDAKIRAEIGARAAVTSVSRFTPTPAVRAVGTYVLRFDGTVSTRSGGRRDVQVLGIDPARFGHVAFWDSSFADQPLGQLVAALHGPAVDGRLPIVAAGLPLGDTDLRVGTVPVPARVVATARVLPGRRTLDPLVYVAADRLPEVPAGAGSDRTAEIWTNGPLDPAVAALTGAGAFVGLQLEPDTVREVANYLGITWTFGYLSALAVFVGVIAVGGLLLYLEARGRSRISGYVMARRLGLSRGAHLRSLIIELGAVALLGLAVGAALAAGAIAAVYRLLDVDPFRPPTPLLAIPHATIAYTVTATALVVILAAAYAQHAADRAQPATVLREDA